MQVVRVGGGRDATARFRLASIRIRDTGRGRRGLVALSSSDAEEDETVAGKTPS